MTGSSILLIGPPLIQKNEYLLKTEIAAAKENHPIIVITTDVDPEHIRMRMREHSSELIAHDDYQKIHFIDCFSLQTNDSIQDTPTVRHVPGPAALTELCVALTDEQARLVPDRSPHLVIFNSLSSILMFVDVMFVSKFVQVIVTRVKGMGGKVLFTLEEGMHDEKVVVSMQHLMDETVQIKRKGDSLYYLSSRGDGGDRWESMAITT